MVPEAPPELTTRRRDGYRSAATAQLLACDAPRSAYVIDYGEEIAGGELVDDRRERHDRSAGRLRGSR